MTSFKRESILKGSCLLIKIYIQTRIYAAVIIEIFVSSLPENGYIIGRKFRCPSLHNLPEVGSLRLSGLRSTLLVSGEKLN